MRNILYVYAYPGMRIAHIHVSGYRYLIHRIGDFETNCFVHLNYNFQKLKIISTIRME